MSEYGTTIKTEKVIGTERRLKGQITINHDYDFDIVKHLTNLGFDVETERKQTGPYDRELYIKVYEIVKHEPSENRKCY